MSTPTTAEQDDLRSRLPDPAQFFPEMGAIAGGMSKATLNGAIPRATAERVALELVEAVLTPNPYGERVPDELYAKASANYDDQALWTLTLVISQIFFFIPVALIAKPIPGKPLGKNYRT
ncbi:MAG TPA: hypothetical protein VM347_00345 [Nonomuraea sp.]|nr:hypothetical protein [Nonomuraea sp.]